MTKYYEYMGWGVYKSDFPEVDMGMKSIYTRILTAFGAGLVPIL